MERNSNWVILVFLSTLLLSACMPVPSASPSGASCGEIAYISDRTGMAEIWLLDLSIGSERQLTETTCDTLSPSPDYIPGVQYFTWAPDGQKIAYLATCTEITSHARLTVIDLETTSVVLLLDQASDSSYPSWAPTGDRFVFALSSDMAKPGMYIANLNGQSSWEINSVTGAAWEGCLAGCYSVTWSPDGTHIAYQGPYVDLPGVGSRTYVSVVDLDGNHVSYEHRTSWIQEPSFGGLTWSNSGCHLAIATALGRTGAHLVMAEVSSQAATIAEAFGLWQHLSDEVTSFGPGFYTPVFSPDDESLYFVSRWSDTEDTRQPFGTIYRVPVQDLLGSSSPDVQVTSLQDQLVGFPSLSPDGNWLLYVVKAGEATEVWLQTVDGSYRQRLVGNDSVNTRPAWRPLSR
jgi:Tol biopolymer transport system component